jgi:nucleotide-binding universal stress UspA family protein
VTTRTVPGDPPAVLEQVAADERATLIVVGSRGRAASGAALLGSTSMSLAGSAARPVMVVPPGGQHWLERAATGGRA